MKVDGTDVNDEHTIGFVKIVDKGKAQQTKVNTERLAKVVAFLKSLKDMGFDDVYITIEDGSPVVIGGKDIGIGLAPVL